MENGVKRNDNFFLGSLISKVVHYWKSIILSLVPSQVGLYFLLVTLQFHILSRTTLTDICQGYKKHHNIFPNFNCGGKLSNLRVRNTITLFSIFDDCGEQWRLYYLYFTTFKGIKENMLLFSFKKNQCCGSGQFFFGSGSGSADPELKIRIRIRIRILLCA